MAAKDGENRIKEQGGRDETTPGKSREISTGSECNRSSPCSEADEDEGLCQESPSENHRCRIYRRQKSCVVNKGHPEPENSENRENSATAFLRSAKRENKCYHCKRRQQKLRRPYAFIVPFEHGEKLVPGKRQHHGQLLEGGFIRPGERRGSFFRSCERATSRHCRGEIVARVFGRASPLRPGRHPPHRRIGRRRERACREGQSARSARPEVRRGAARCGEVSSPDRSMQPRRLEG